MCEAFLCPFYTAFVPVYPFIFQSIFFWTFFFSTELFCVTIHRIPLTWKRDGYNSVKLKIHQITFEFDSNNKMTVDQNSNLKGFFNSYSLTYRLFQKLKHDWVGTDIKRVLKIYNCLNTSPYSIPELEKPDKYSKQNSIGTKIIKQTKHNETDETKRQEKVLNPTKIS